MTTMGILTELLSKRYQEAGYELSEDEDFLNLWKDGKQIATFNAHATSMDRVNEFIYIREK